MNNWRTRCYDQFQYCVQGILWSNAQNNTQY
jgi:hypothetical protein